MVDRMWAELFFEEAEKAAWWRAGIYEPTYADKCRSNGLAPEDMAVRVDGRRVGERVAGARRCPRFLIG